jgi:LmbE family N-acetylglucosaminyl deacetylase
VSPGRARGRSGLSVGDLPAAGTITVDLPVPASALAIGAHPDDIEFGCGATLAKWAAGGCRVHHLILTDGSKGSWDPDADLSLLVSSRAEECRAAARVIDGGRPGPRGTNGSDQPDQPGGDRVLFLGRVDGELENGLDERRQVAQVIRQLRPAVLLGHDRWRRYRLHPDHLTAGSITTDALVAARDPHFFPELGLEPHRPEALLLWEADLPNHLEDASRFGSTKVAALLCHRSQFESTMGIDPGAEGPAAEEARRVFGAKVADQLADHGALLGIDRAEAFHLMDDV